MNPIQSITHFLILVLTSTVLSGAEIDPKPAVLDYYNLETIPLPEGETSADAIAFMPDGRLACALSLSKIFFYHPDTGQWDLFAEGLHTPLGILPLNNHEILVAQRPEITQLVDRNKDGKADLFKTVSDDFGMSGNYAEFNFGPVKDKKGNLYYGLGTGSAFGNLLTDEVRGSYSRAGHDGRMNSSAPYRGWIMKVTPDGQTIPWANGFREPNSLGLDLEDNLWVADNQGDWVGSSKLFHVREGGFYGHPHSLVWRGEINRHPFDIPVADLDRMRTRASVIFPHGEMSTSPTQPIIDTTGGRFGPFEGQMFIGEMNFDGLIRVMLEKVDGEFQGACIPFFDHAGMNLGNNRLAFHPENGSLWFGQTKHEAWVGASGLQRLMWNGVTPLEVQAMHLTESGFDLTFTLPINPETASDPENYTIESYFYNYHERYGSGKYAQTREPVSSVIISKDRKTVSLHLGDMKAWRLYDLKIKDMKSQDGHPLINKWMVYTLNRLLKNTPAPPAPESTPAPRRTTPNPPPNVKSVGGPQAFISLSTPSKVNVYRTDGGFRFTENDQAVLEYIKDPIGREDGRFQRGHYVHPVYDLDGYLMSHDMPQDHPHHRAVFWAWTQLWVGEKRIGHPWEQRGLEWNVTDVRVSGDATSSAIHTDVLWESPLWTDDKAKMIPIVEEHATIRVHASTAERRLIDFDITLKALEENVRLGGSTDTKGYGGFSSRIPLPEDLKIMGSDGPVVPNLQQPSVPQAWVDFTADFNHDGKITGEAILCHPDTPGYPQGWTIRNSGSCQNPVWPGNEPVTLPREQPIRLRYRLILHRGDTEQADIAALFEQYSKE